MTQDLKLALLKEHSNLHQTQSVQDWTASLLAAWFQLCYVIWAHVKLIQPSPVIRFTKKHQFDLATTGFRGVMELPSRLIVLWRIHVAAVAPVVHG